MILVTGAAGYIGSHMIAKLLEHNKEIVAVDNLSNSNRNNLNKIEKFYNKKIHFYNYDLLDIEKINLIFKKYNIQKVLHFAGLKSISESISKPQLYYDNNVLGSLNLLKLSKMHRVQSFVFSSTASIYGTPKFLPITENHPLNPLNPYSESKFIIEKNLKDDKYFNENCSTTIFRYFNPVGSNKKIKIFEDPINNPSNIMPLINQVAQKKLPLLKIYGDNYKTNDGTGVRDYIHILDLIDAHYKSLYFKRKKLNIYNLGTGKGFSVLELIHTFEAVNKVKISYDISNRRPGDVDEVYASASLAFQEFGWKTKYSIKDMCKDSLIFLEK